MLHPWCLLVLWQSYEETERKTNFFLFFLKYNGYLQMAFAMSFSSRHCPRLMVSFSLWCSHGARISNCPLAQGSIVFLSIVSFSKDTTFFKKMFYLCN